MKRRSAIPIKEPRALRVIIIGAGLMGRWHAFYAHQAGAQIVAVVDPRTERAAELASSYAARVHATPEEALAQADVDLVHICTPIDSHPQLVGAALEAGKHVIVEKPLTRTLGELEPLLERAQAAGLCLIPVHQFALQPGVQAALEELGRRAEPALSVSFDLASAGGAGRGAAQLDRILAEILPHPLSILQRLWPSASLDEGSWSVLHPAAGELLAQGVQAGLPVALKISMNARPTHCEMTIYHAAGALKLDLFHGFLAVENPTVSRQAKLLAPFARSSKTMALAAANLARRSFSRQPAYPGLKQLIASSYQAAAGQAVPPISPLDARVVAQGCDLIGEQLAAS